MSDRSVPARGGDQATALLAELRGAEPDLYLTVLMTPLSLRPKLLTLFALWAQIHRSAQQASEPMIGEIRLAWWREHLPNAFAGEGRGHPLLQTVAANAETFEPVWPDLEAIIDAYTDILYAPAAPDRTTLEVQLAATHGGLLRLAVTLAGQSDGAAKHAATSAGIAWGAAQLYLRLGHLLASESGADLLRGEGLDLQARQKAVLQMVNDHLALARQQKSDISGWAAAPLRLSRLARPHWQADRHALQRFLSMWWASLRQTY